ncbi:MAG: hypothetical protein ACK5T7_06935, partial [Gemmatimonas sp.]
GRLAPVGAGPAAGTQAMAPALAARGPSPEHMAALSATGINFPLVIDDDQVVAAMQRLHATFFEQTP